MSIAINALATTIFVESPRLRYDNAVVFSQIQR
ncbi:unnamed protein product, partial [marine sediment metagenome]